MRYSLIKYLALLLLAINSVAATFTGVSGGGWSAEVNANTAFQEITGSALETYASQVPYTYLDTNDGADQTPLVDYSGWQGYDVTCESNDGGCSAAVGTSKFPAAWGCDPMGTGVADNAAPIRCMFLGANANEYLYVPDGTYDFTTGSGGAVQSAFDIKDIDNTGLLGESKAGTIFVLGDGTPHDLANNTPADSMGLIGSGNTCEGGENYCPASGATWSAGTTRGTQILTVSTTAPFTEDVTWIRLEAPASGTQAGAIVLYHAQVVCVAGTGSDCAGGVSAGQIKIDRPLPVDFGAGRSIDLWNPQVNLFFESFTVTPANPNHVQYNQTIINIANCRSCHVKDVKVTEGYNRLFSFSGNARTRVESNDIDSVWDKPFNGYGLDANNGSDNLYLDNLVWNMPQTMLCGAYEMQPVFAFNSAINNEPNALYDTSGDTGAQVALHSGAHGVEAAPAGYMHCSTNYDDRVGNTGSASCRGTRSSQVRASFFLHNNVCTNATIIRNRFESGIAFDTATSNGPGNNHLILGNTLIDPADEAGPNEIGTPNGTFSDIAAAGGNPTSWRHDWIWMNNSMEQFGLTNYGFDQWMDGAVVTDNVFRGECHYYGNAAKTGGGYNSAADADCGVTNVGRGDIDGTITWSDNDVNHGAAARTSTNVMPSAPGFGPWIKAYMEAKGGSGDFPWAGADMGGNGGAGSNCNPAYMRYYGTCPGAGVP